MQTPIFQAYGDMGSPYVAYKSDDGGGDGEGLPREDHLVDFQTFHFGHGPESEDEGREKGLVDSPSDSQHLCSRASCPLPALLTFECLTLRLCSSSDTFSSCPGLSPGKC